MDCSPNKVFSACDQVRMRKPKNVGVASRVIFYYNGHGAMSCAHPSSENGKCIWVVNYTGLIVLLISQLTAYKNTHTCKLELLGWWQLPQKRHTTKNFWPSRPFSIDFLSNFVSGSKKIIKSCHPYINILTS